MTRILLIEDDARIREALQHALRERGHVVVSLASGMPALQAALDEQPEVVVLDLGLPDVDGVEWLRMFRGISQVPVVVATARDDESAIVRTLDVGADDYVVKPFSAAQLDARIRAVLRRAGGGSDRDEPLTLGELTVDASGREAQLAGEPLELSRLEFDLLLCLARRAGEVVTKREIMAEVWHQPYNSSDKTVDVHLSWLRRKLGESAAEPRYLHTVRGVGIKLAPPT
ncbi:MAG: response regulator transcription factor [Actinomycetes bacterium]